MLEIYYAHEKKNPLLIFIFSNQLQLLIFFYLENEKFLVVLKLNEWGDKNHTHRK